MTGIINSIQVTYKGRSMLARRLYKLRTGKEIRGFELQYLWKRGESFYSEKILSSLDLKKSAKPVALDRYHRMDWNKGGEIISGSFAISINKQ